ncbi:Ig-like domain-containing protein [Flavobacterium sp.]
MKKNYYILLVFVLFLSLFVACSDDDDYVPVANPPVATDDTLNSTLTSPVVISVLANDTTGGIPDPTTVSILNGTDTDANGTLNELVVANQGTWSVNPTTGDITFTPTPTFTGNPTQISYTVANADGEVSNTAIVTINAVPIVTADLANVPYAKLSDYHFFIGDIKNMTPSLNVIAYEPASTLFTDYALKKRFIWMPSGVRATYVADDKTLEFPVGTILIKSFYYNTIQPGNTTKIIETRLMVRRADRWHFYEYVWNDAQTDADLVAGADFENGDARSFSFRKPNGEIVAIDYRIPSESECYACHKINEIRTPIGVKPQNLNFSMAYNEGDRNQLQKLVDQGYLDSYPSNIVSIIDYHDTTKPIDLRFRSYIDANCAHCHQEDGRCDYRALRLGFAQSSVDANLGICVQADEVISPTLQKLISPGNYNKSIIHYRMNSNDESERMPLLGRTIVHDEGIQLVQEYISSLTQVCN